MPHFRSIARGPIWSDFEGARRSSILLDAALPCLAPAFVSKGRIGRHYRAVSTNGYVLLLTRREAGEMEDAITRLRLSIWHRSNGAGGPAAPWGIALCALPDCAGFAEPPHLLFAKLDSGYASDAALSLELGGERFVNFMPAV
jgi:hypothetical protein